MLGSIKWGRFQSHHWGNNVNSITETWLDKAVLSPGMGQSPCIFQVCVCLFSPGLRKYRKLKEWNQIFKAPSIFMRSTSGGFCPSIWSLAWAKTLRVQLGNSSGESFLPEFPASLLRGPKGLNLLLLEFRFSTPLPHSPILLLYLISSPTDILSILPFFTFWE